MVTIRQGQQTFTDSATTRMLVEVLLDPETPDDRRLAVKLFVDIALLDGDNMLPASARAAGSLGSNLRCCNCDQELARAELYCGNFCR
jgi:hypothetical protein